MLIALLLAIPALPAQAVAIDVIRTEGNQQQGRWQVFDLDLDQDGNDVVVWWQGNANVNIFLRDANGNNLATGTRTSGQPEYLIYNGNQRPAELAILVKSGSATGIVARVHVHGTAPWLQKQGLYDGGTPTPPPPPNPDPPPPPTQTAGDYPGQPAAGTVLWGASLPGNEDPWNRLEKASGDPLGVRRTYFRWNQRTSWMLTILERDMEAGRVPWASIKVDDWRPLANGQRDNEIDQMLRGLGNLDGPVWLTVHHEPEGGGGSNTADRAGGPSAHLAMNRRVRQRMNALGIDNVALSPILMAWSWDSRSGRNVNEWWDSDVYDFVGVDIYDRSGNGLFVDYWYEVREWAERERVDVGVAEWGIEGSNSTSADRMRQWHQAAVDSHNDGRGARVVALSTYDNPVGGWRLEGQQLTTFRNLVGHAKSTHP